MQVIARARFVRRSPLKVRLVARVVKGMKVAEALSVLEFMPQHAAKDVAKVIKSASANAEHNYNLDPDKLVVTNVIVNDGPRLKRYRPRARGLVHPYMRRLCHIVAIVEDKAV
jgi:large subunit ribosomal protein L22